MLQKEDKRNYLIFLFDTLYKRNPYFVEVDLLFNKGNINRVFAIVKNVYLSCM